MTDDKHRLAGQPYRPSNGSEGDAFQARWCEGCERDAAYRRREVVGGCEAEGCKILSSTMLLDVDDEEYPPEWVHNDRGVPVCLAFVLKDYTYRVAHINESTLILEPVGPVKIGDPSRGARKRERAIQREIQRRQHGGR